MFSKKQVGYYSRQSSHSNEPRIIKCTFDQLAVNCTTNPEVPIRDGSLFTIACCSNIWHFHTPFLYVLGGVNWDTVAVWCRYSYLSMSRISTVQHFLRTTCDNWYRRRVKTLHSSRMWHRTLSLTSGFIWGWVVNATTPPLYPRERNGTHCIGGWMGPRATWYRVIKQTASVKVKAAANFPYLSPEGILVEYKYNFILS